MKLDAATIAQLTKVWPLQSYVRVSWTKHELTPLGMAPGESRFSSLKKNYLVLYAARDLRTAVAETIIRDRFEGRKHRRLFVEEIRDRIVIQVSSRQPLKLLDIRADGCFKLGISTNTTGAKAHRAGRRLSQYIHDVTCLDGMLYNSRLTHDDCVVVFDRAVAPIIFANRVSKIEQLKNLCSAFRSLRVDIIP